MFKKLRATKISKNFFFCFLVIIELSSCTEKIDIHRCDFFSSSLSFRKSWQILVIIIIFFLIIFSRLEIHASARYILCDYHLSHRSRERHRNRAWKLIKADGIGPPITSECTFPTASATCDVSTCTLRPFTSYTSHPPSS